MDHYRAGPRAKHNPRADRVWECPMCREAALSLTDGLADLFSSARQPDGK